MFDKIWDRHVVATAESGMTLLYIDRCFIHEGSRHAFQMLKERGLPAARPEQVIACSDHYVPTRHRARGLAAISDDKIRGMVELLEQNTHEHGIRLFGMGDGAQGILHVVGPEQGITQPGLVIVGGDSHTSTHGALGNLSFGIGASEAPPSPEPSRMLMVFPEKNSAGDWARAAKEATTASNVNSAVICFVPMVFRSMLAHPDPRVPVHSAANLHLGRHRKKRCRGRG